LSHDSIVVWLGRPPVMNEQVSQIMGNWQPAHIFDNILPVLRNKGINEIQFDKMLGGNAKALFAGSPVRV
jgi:phosphotriesterase-related protein